MEDTLFTLRELVTKLSMYTSPYDKIAILRQYPNMKDILKIIYDDNLNFYITGDRLQEYLDMQVPLERIVKVVLDDKVDIFSLLERLYTRTVTGNDAVDMCITFILTNWDYRELILRIFNRNLLCGISVKTLNKAFPGILPEFNVPLSNEYNPNKHKIFEGDYLLSRKLDGIRCLCFIKNDGTVSFFTRNGKPILTLGVIEQELQVNLLLTNRLGHVNPIIDIIESQGIVLDGEICIVNDNGIEDFQAMDSEYRRLDHTIQNPMFYVFDFYSIPDFENSYEGGTSYSLKYSLLKSWIVKFNHIKLLEQVALTYDTQLSIPEGWEGFIARKDASTLFKRSNNLLKIKLFKEAEYEVLDVITSTITIEGQTLNVIGSLLIYHNGTPVHVGSGLTQNQRIDWYAHPEKILGKTITVKYFSETINRSGEVSLRFPILKSVRWDV